MISYTYANMQHLLWKILQWMNGMHEALLSWIFLHSWMLLYACIHPSDWEPKGADEVWEGVNDSDIITACRLVLFHCPHTDRSSIVPALRGLPRFPCVRNHPPTCYSRQGPKTVKLYTESLWAAGQGPDERQCGCGENNKRQAPTQSTFCTRTYLQRCRPATHTHTYIHAIHTHVVTLQAHTAQTWGPMGLGVWGLVERWVAGEMDGCWWIGWMRSSYKSWFTTAELISGSTQSWFGFSPGWVCWHRWTFTLLAHDTSTDH